MKFLKKIKKFDFVFAVILVLVGSLIGYQIVQAATGQGSANIDGGAPGGNATVDQSVSHKFTVVLTIGASGITTTADSPTFTLPTGFTAPTNPVATAGLVLADGDWFAVGGATCPITMSSSSTSGQKITIDVTTVCTVGAGGIITLTYQGKSATTMAAAPLNITTAVDVGSGAGTNITAPPTITVTAASADLSLTKIVDNATPSVGDTIVFTVTVTNSGPDAATGVIVGDLLPSGLSWVSDDSSDTYNRGSGVWTIGVIANGASKTLIVSATVNGADVDTITNTAEITASNEVDVDSTDDQDSVDVVVNTPPPDPEDEVIPPPSPSHSSSGSTPTYGCKDPTATNYNYFSASNPALCTYANIPIVTPTVVNPLLPKAGFPPQTLYGFILNSFLSLFR